MKKILALFSTLVLAVTLFACQQVTTTVPLTTAVPTTSAQRRLPSNILRRD